MKNVKTKIATIAILAALILNSISITAFADDSNEVESNYEIEISEFYESEYEYEEDESYEEETSESNDDSDEGSKESEEVEIEEVSEAAEPKTIEIGGSTGVTITEKKNKLSVTIYTMYDLSGQSATIEGKNNDFIGEYDINDSSSTTWGDIKFLTFKNVNLPDDAVFNGYSINAELVAGQYEINGFYNDGKEVKNPIVVKSGRNYVLIVLVDGDKEEPEITDPEVTDPEVTDPEITDPETTDPEVVDPEVIEPEITEPEVTEPEVTDPEVTDPEITDPGIIDPEIVEPETTNPEIVPTPNESGSNSSSDKDSGSSVPDTYRDYVVEAIKTNDITKIFETPVTLGNMSDNPNTGR